MGALDFRKEDFLQPGYITQIGYPPLRIDILNNIDGVEFTEAVSNRQKITLDDGLEVFFIGLQDFLRNKEAAGRSQDLADIKEIKKKLPRQQNRRGK
jgi:predicted nucleotidyltransferase